MLLGHAEFLHHHLARRAHAEAVDAERLAFGADVIPPQIGHAGFDRAELLGVLERQKHCPVVMVIPQSRFYGEGKTARESALALKKKDFQRKAACLC